MTLGRSIGLSHPGRRRRHNEDSWVCQPPIFAVADGMGGAQGGEIASGLAASALGEEVDGSGEERVAGLVQEANRRVYERASEDSAASGMGTTITLAVVEDGRVTIGHVGDSRAYLIRDRTLEQLTNDHSLVAELVRTGKLSPEEAEAHPQRSVITRALGTDPEVDVDTFSVDAKPGDLFLLCSDGLTGMVGNETILDVVTRHRDDLEATAQELVAAANRGGGEDNITVVVFEIAEEGAETKETRDDLAAVEEDKPDDDSDEDTLSGLEHVPAVATRVISREEIENLTSPAPTPRRRGRSLFLFLLLLLLIGGAAVLYWSVYL